MGTDLCQQPAWHPHSHALRWPRDGFHPGVRPSPATVSSRANGAAASARPGGHLRLHAPRGSPMMAQTEGTPIERYYRLHSRIYDATRWSFLFGRSRLLHALADEAPRRILEVGCGTGRNLVALGQRFPHASLAGVDLSPAMLSIASRKLEQRGLAAEWHQRAYHAPLSPEEPFDLVVFSYALSMFNPGFESAIEAAHADLAPGGKIAVVDFH